MKKKISLRVIRRISLYYEALLKSNLLGDSYISSKKIEEITGVSCNQVRQDFFYLGISIGKQKKGYLVKRLFKELKKILSIEKGARVVVIGAGRLGRALAEYKIFRARNINVVSLFDIKEELIGTSVKVKDEEYPIFDINYLEEYMGEHPEIKVALLTVPEGCAQEVLDKLLNLGIKGIVNYAPKILKIPKNHKNVTLINDCLGASLYKIVFQI